MDFHSVHQTLLELNEREKHYKEHPVLSQEYYQKLSKKNVKNDEVYIFDDLIPTGQNFNVVKHTRFIPVPLHVHNFIELNYIYSGKCTQIIDGKKVTLTKGQICLIDISVPHSIETTSEEDIIINILVKKDYFIKQLSQEKFSSSIVFDFILNALSETQSHNQYIVFQKSEYDQIQLIIDQILYEYFEKKVGNTLIIENLIAILFTLLVRNFNYDTNRKEKKNKEQIVNLLQYIDKHFMNLTLADLAKRFNYTSNYLSILLKKETGKNFSQLILEKKLDQAEILLQHTEKTIQECAEESGFSNITFFYEKYKNYFHKFPSQRKRSTEP
ncbi:AraC family transcriptional regulator [Enterococcus sp. OL5]|uniref:AraC family transcriptional regulator n=1 Tax=Enterococcus sp. OL5 TaxID=2590214 RepID=UPI00112A3139|nr:AraC family transcriptional regulator [Enterococcus sp. OL5]TPR55551.1 AraC family transcriptional regulator [Enterococcus sp. OL5]